MREGGYNGVSVPLRGYGFEMLFKDLDGVNPLKFPSPYGDMVLKSQGFLGTGINLPVSVPLRGYGFEMLAFASAAHQGVSLVSVPLRGYGFEISSKSANLRVQGRFRPLAGIWF